MSSQNRIGFILAAVVVISALVLVFNRGAGAASTSHIGDVSVSCGPAQRAVVQKANIGGSMQVNVSCVDDAVTSVAGSVTHEAGQVAPVAYAPTLAPVAAMPAVMYVPETRTVQAPARPVATTPAPSARRVDRTPSWQKRVLIVGGSAGAGAGTGALVGGRKGALIGAAIGGGGAAVVDQVKHR